MPLLYDWCVEELLHDRTTGQRRQRTGRRCVYTYKAADPAPWGAEQAWQRWWAVEDAPTGEWLVCWPGRIVVLEPGFELTREQIAKAAEKTGAVTA